MQPHIITLSSLNLGDCLIMCSLNFSLAPGHVHLHLSDPYLFIFILSETKTLSQSFIIKYLYFFAKLCLNFPRGLVNVGFSTFARPRKLVFLKIRGTVSMYTNIGIIGLL